MNEFTKTLVEENQLIKKFDRVKILSLKKPFWDGWMILLPNIPLTYLDEFDIETFTDCIALGKTIENVFRSQNSYIGYTFMLNRGLCAGQKVPHAHFHFIPLFSDRSANPFSSANKDVTEVDLKNHVAKYAQIIPGELKELSKTDNVTITTKKVDRNGVSLYTLSTTPHKKLFDLSKSDIAQLLKKIAELHNIYKETKYYCGYNVTITHKTDDKELQGPCLNWIPRYVKETTNPLKLI